MRQNKSNQVRKDRKHTYSTDRKICREKFIKIHEKYIQTYAKISQYLYIRKKEKDGGLDVFRSWLNFFRSWLNFFRSYCDFIGPCRKDRKTIRQDRKYSTTGPKDFPVLAFIFSVLAFIFSVLATIIR